MEEPSFDALASEAAAGLKDDRELFLEIKQELHTHLEDKAAHLARTGHGEAESIALSKQSFGSPLDMAAELVEANRGRMRLRALLRLAFNALIIPLAIVLALYMGYGRLARFSWIQANMARFSNNGHQSFKLPALPLFGIAYDPFSQAHGDAWLLDSGELRLLDNGDLNGGVDLPQYATDIHKYWEAHRSEPDGNIYYAYYSEFLNNADPAPYRQGEQLEPQNALYNIDLTVYYLWKGFIAKEERSCDPASPLCTDEVTDRRAFELGIAELQRSVHKPYLHTYQMAVLRKKLNALPAPRFTEDYIQQEMVAAAELYPECSRWRNLARKIPGCARVLLAEGRRADAEAVMDSWKPLTRLLAQDSSNGTLIQALVARAVAAELSKGASDVYERIGANAKAAEARRISTQLKQDYTAWRAEGSTRDSLLYLREHGSLLANILNPTFGCSFFSRQELTPGRMHEHVLMEEIAVQGVLLLLVLALLGTLAQGVLWLHQLRRAAAIPFLLLPPAKVMLRALLLGIALPMLVYWLYSRCPIVGGREFSWSSAMRPRFIIELCLLGLLMLWLPAQCIRRYLVRRCADLGIVPPSRREEHLFRWQLHGVIAVVLLLAAVGVKFSLHAFASKDVYSLTDTLAVLALALLLALGLSYGALRYAMGKRHEYGLYYGTLARSLAPVYAFSILFLTLAVQPWLLYHEATWLQKDTLVLGRLANRREISGVYTSLETKTALQIKGLVLTAMTARGEAR